MPRKPLLRTDIFPYHITARVNNREIFPLPLEDIWIRFSREFFRLHIEAGFRIHALVLMPNHFHMIAQTDGVQVDTVMKRFMERTTRLLNGKSNRCGHLYGSRYFWNLIKDPIYYAHATKYVYLNPVKANLCERAENWPWGTLGGLIGNTHLPFPLFHEGGGIHERTPKCLWQRLKWINHKYSSEENEALRKAFRRKIFKIPRRPSGTNFAISDRI